MEESSKRLGKRVEKQVIIMDLAGLSLSPNKIAMAMFKETIRVDQAFYPERLHKVRHHSPCCAPVSEIGNEPRVYVESTAQHFQLAHRIDSLAFLRWLAHALLVTLVCTCTCVCVCVCVCVCACVCAQAYAVCTH
jgi:hypothetical protein